MAFYYYADASARRGHADVARRALLDYEALEGEDLDGRRRAALGGPHRGPVARGPGCGRGRSPGIRASAALNLSMRHARSAWPMRRSGNGRCCRGACHARTGTREGSRQCGRPPAAAAHSIVGARSAFFRRAPRGRAVVPPSGEGPYGPSMRRRRSIFASPCRVTPIAMRRAAALSVRRRERRADEPPFELLTRGFERGGRPRPRPRDQCAGSAEGPTRPRLGPCTAIHAMTFCNSRTLPGQS